MVLFAALACGHSDAQHFARARHLDTREGLAHDIVLSVLRDSRGFMWFGTRDGLDRYDGYTFRHYRSRPFDANSLPSNVVLSLAEDPWGLLWIGTDGGGLCAYDRVRDAYTHFRHDPVDGRSIGGDIITALVIDSSHTLWIGTAGGGVSRLDLRAYHAREGKTIERARFMTITAHGASGHRLSDDCILGLYLNSDASIWATTSGGNHDRIDIRSGMVRTYWFTGKGYRTDAAPVIRNRGTRFRFLPTTSHSFIFCDGPVIYHYISERDEIIRSASLPGIRDTSRFVLLRADSHRLTVLDMQGLYTIQARDGTVSRIPLQFSSDQPMQFSGGIGMTYAWDGEVWLLIGGHGLAVVDFSQTAFRQCLPRENGVASRPERTIRALAEDAGGRIFAGIMHRGLATLDTAPAPAFRFNTDGIWPRDHDGVFVVNDIAVTRDGGMLLATRSNILQREHGSRVWKKIAFAAESAGMPTMQRSPYANWFAVCVDRNAGMWTGGVSGRRGILVRRDGTGACTSFSDERDASSRRFGSGVWTIMEDGDGVIWIGAQNGLHAYDPRLDAWRHYQHDVKDSRTLIHNEIWTMHDDGRGTLWIGTLGGGLDALEKRTGTFRHVTVRNGLASDLVLGILGDPRGRLWLSTGAGITRFDPRTGEIQNLRGGVIEAVMPFSFGSALRASSGTLYFGGNAGALAFHPDSVEAPETPPRLVISGVRVPGVHESGDILDGDTLTVPHTAKLLTVEFSALDFRNPSGMRYAYRLDERDTTWIPLGTDHQLTLMELQPGLHTLRVKGANSEGVWNERGLVLHIRVIPPWHMTWWARALAGLLLLSAVVGGGMQRARVLHRREQTRRRLIESELKALRAQMNPHFLFNCLGAVQSAMLGNDIERANDLLAKIARLTRMVLEHSAQKVVPLEEEMTLLRLYCEMEALRHGGRFVWSVDADPALPPDLPLPSMLIQPYVENAIQHGLRPLTRTGVLRIALTPSKDGVLCVIEDNGIGRAAAMEQRQQRNETRRSMGMELTRERLEILNEFRSRRMQLTVTDLLDADGLSAGTRITIVIPSETD